MNFLRWYAPIALIAVTLNLRAGLLTVGPVLPAIVRGLDLSPLASGLLTSLPILALGLASAAAVSVGRAVGWSGGLIVAMLLTGAGIWLRSSGGETALFAGALVLGAGIGLGNVFVPTLVKARFAKRIGIGMGVYTMGLTLGAMLSANLTPTLFARFADWRPTLAVWAIAALVAGVLAVPMVAENPRPQARVPGLGLWANGVAWSVTAFMGLQSALFYSIAQWLGALLTGRGVALHDIALDLQIFYFTQFVAALALPVFLTRSRRQDIVAAALGACVGVLVAGILYGPPAGIFALCALLGLTVGGIFAVALTFQVIRAHTAENAARLSAMAQCAGYIIASLGPLVLGLMSKWPDARLASTIWLVLLALITMVAGVAAGRPRYVDEARPLLHGLASQ